MPDLPASKLPHVTVRMPESERKALRILAAKRGESLQTLCIRAIRTYVATLGEPEPCRGIENG